MEFILDYDDTKNKYCVARDLIICETEHTWPKFVKRDHFFIASVQSNTFCIVSIYDFREQIQAIFFMQNASNGNNQYFPANVSRV